MSQNEPLKASPSSLPDIEALTASWSQADDDALAAGVLSAVHQATTPEALEALRIAVAGKNGILTRKLKELGSLSVEEKKTKGAALNKVKTVITEALAQKAALLQKERLEQRLLTEKIDVTLPATPFNPGKIHPISQTIEEICAFFQKDGFSVQSGSSVETQWFNFSALNIPAHHPARTEQDTFYLNDRDAEGLPKLLRTQTSNVQIKTLLTQKPPFRIISPGRTYRSDNDATHSPMFHQCEGLVIGKDLSLGHLKGCLSAFLRAFFQHPDPGIRFRSSYFPFTEPSLEVDIARHKKTGLISKAGEADTEWLEVLGAGMTNSYVLANCGLDPEIWSGFAFGLGIERLAMLKYGIPDLRAFYENDSRWSAHYGFSSFSAL